MILVAFARRWTPGAQRDKTQKGNTMLGTILLVVLILLLIGGLPLYPYSRKWGYAPGGVLGLLLLVLIILMIMGRI